MKSSEIRTAFLEFFRARGHEVVASSPLVPGNDPTLLFTNAGMVQFKDVFLGLDKRPYTRAATVQRCVRAGGKHNDLENVGYTARHHTFFEMLGNFSFGDYFKRDAIHYAWSFLTETLKLPKERLWVTVYKDDDEAAEIWVKQIGVPADRCTRLGEKSNFWAMGDTGPCGPCTEIFYDHGPEIAGGPPGSPDEDGDRYIEIWNLVFMQYERDAQGNLKPLPKPSVDTGMGLERLAAVMQRVHSNYEIDTFQRLIKEVAALAHTSALDNPSLKVIADHIRSCAFLVTDGVIPSNEGRGYVLRRIIRRALRHGHKLGIRETFFHKLVKPLAEEMGASYPELIKAGAQVERVLRQEEERFAETLDQGMQILEQAIRSMPGKIIAGQTVFKLYDTYGFPADLTADIARERGLGVDMEGFERAMDEQRERARASSQFDVAYPSALEIQNSTQFVGYDRLDEMDEIVALFREGQPVSSLKAGERGTVVLNKTPFYAESGGQVGDRGLIVGPTGRFEVHDTRKQGEAHAHHGTVASGELRMHERVEARVDLSARQSTAGNHSATHLLHGALRTTLGDHVQQKGSLVAPDRLRFDFAHFEPLTSEQLRQIEDQVNAQIRANVAVETRVMDVESAVKSGAMALFGEKYGAQVRVLSMGTFSTELCGGTHVSRTGDIGLFKILYESGVAAGVRRIEAMTGRGALIAVRENEARLEEIAELIKASRDAVVEKVAQLVERTRRSDKEIEQLKGKLASSQGTDLAAQAVDVAGVRVLAARLDGADPKALRDTVDQLKNKLGTAAIVLAAVHEGKVSLVAGVTKDAMDRVSAGALVNVVAERIGGKGGGRADMAQAGGTRPEGLPEAFAAAVDWVRSLLR